MIPALGEREETALSLLARFHFLTRSQLQAFLFPDGVHSEASARVMTRRVLQRLTSQGLISRTRRFIGGACGGSGQHAYFPTTSGARLLSSPEARRQAPRGSFLLRHALAVADVALSFKAAALHRGERLASFECDREAAQRIGSKTLVPDAFLIYEAKDVELHAFLEVDLGTVGSRQFARKVETYLSLWRTGAWQEAHGLWPTVLVVVPDEARLRLLLRATEALLRRQPDEVAAQTEFAFATASDIRAKGPLSPIWEVAGRTGRQGLLEGGAAR